MFVEMLKSLMDSNGLKAADLVPLFGTKSIASEVLSGKRQLSKIHIANLSEYFSLSPAAFFTPVANVPTKEELAKRAS